MPKKKILIATTNVGKCNEMKKFLGDLPFSFISLNDIKEKIKAPEENEPTIWGNAMLKAVYYAEKTGIATLADDSGLFIETLNGWPGVISARIGRSNEARRKLILQKMNKKINRNACFKAALSFYDPNNQSSFTATGKSFGEILKKEDKNDNGFGYDPIFFSTEKNKPFSQMTMEEKNSCSHRGKALIQMKYFLHNQYGSRHIVVPVAIIIKNGEVLIAQRNDPFRLEYHEKWEFPGGSMEFGETFTENLIREVKEETGVKIKPLSQLHPILVRGQKYPTWSYQVYLIPFLCSVVNSKEKINDSEVLDLKWVSINNINKLSFVGENKELFKSFLPELKNLIKKYKLD